MFTGLRTARKCLAKLEKLEEWAIAADRTIRQQEQQIVELRGAHAKLRGKLYGDGLHRAAEPDSVAGGTREQRKAAAFAKLGIVPGRTLKVASDETK